MEIAPRRSAPLAPVLALVVGMMGGIGCSEEEQGPGPAATGGGGAGATGGTGGSTGGAGGSVGGSGGAGGTVVDPLPGEKWIPTFVVKYGSPGANLLSPAETANFDLIIVSPSHHQSWAEGANSWETLKGYNPDMVITLYVLGPSEFNTASWSVLGDQWDWVRSEHGIGSADPWPCHGYDNPDRYLYNDAYPNERIMNLGRPAWRQFFTTEVYQALWGTSTDHVGADGLFSDVTTYDVPYAGHWRVVDGPNADQTDHPAAYYDGSSYDDVAHRAEMNTFFDEALPWWASQDAPVLFTNNFGSLTSPEDWSELDQRAHHPYAAMAEAGLLQPYGNFTFGVFNFQDKLSTMQSLQNVKLINMSHGKAAELSGDGLARMDASGTTGPGSGATTMTGWEALWFSICAHMAGINAERNSAYLGFTVWGYGEYHWFDELDPTYLHLGEPVAAASVVDGATVREFDDGWVVCNGTTDDLSGLSVPAGQARVIDHDNFKTPDSAPWVTTFDLPLHRGVVLLKEGRALGNQD